MNRYRAILFDLNGTLIDIRTDEANVEVYRTCAHLLGAYGVTLSMEEFRNRFYELAARQRKERHTEYPEFDVVAIFRTILHESGGAVTRALSRRLKALLPEFLAQAFRAASMQKLELYPCVHQVLEELQQNYLLAAVSDAQLIWAEAEMRRLGLELYFPVRIISGAYGFRKPTPALFQYALDRLQTRPQEAIFVGNDMYRDICGAGRLGMKSVFFRSNQGDQRDHGVAPDYIIYRFEELPDAVRFLEKHGNII